MCLIALAVAPRPDLSLVVIANRDEHYARPTERMHAWRDGSGVIAGVDLEGGGTWLGIDRRLRFAAITNVRDPRDLRPREPGERSRGELVRAFLLGDEPASRFAERATREVAMRGFNLLLVDAGGLVWCSNRAPSSSPRAISAGIHGVSNALLDTPWPKVERAERALAPLLAPGIAEPEPEALFAILADDTPAPDDALPDTGVGLELERALSPIRIALPTYGTRCSTVLIVRASGSATIIERTLAPERLGDVRFDLPIPP
jgi:uncharacterized protein with NRDE domain